MKKQIYIYVGTIAELIKLAAVLKRLSANKIPFKIITSGQNEINFKELRPIIGFQRAHISFPNKSKELSAIKFAFWAVRSFFISIWHLRGEFNDKKRTYFVVHGDTVSALIGALIAKFYGLKIIHIEAGYRSFNFFEPFPEEVCRVLVSYLADVHFCPDNWSLNNLKKHKGVKISTKENTLYETCMKALRLNINTKNLSKITKNKYFLLVLHRQEHVMYKKDLSRKYIDRLTLFANSNIKCVFVLHKLTENFLVEQNILDKLRKNPNIILVPRLPYLEFLQVLKNCEFIATDGGSNQDEAYFLGKPCLLLRKYTEQVEGLGENVALAKDDLLLVDKFLQNYQSKKRKPIKMKIPPSKIILNYFTKI